MLCFEIRELNLRVHPQFRETSTATCNVLPPGANLATHLHFQSYANPEFMGSRNRCDGMHSDAIMRNFRALHGITQNGTHQLAIYCGTSEFMKHRSHNMTYILHNHLHVVELCIHHGHKVQVEGLECECISQMCRWTGNQSWCRGDQHHYWVWVK